MSIAEKLVTIAENQQKVYEAGQNDFGFKGSASGELATLNNVHSKEHNVKTKLRSKNLFESVDKPIKIDPTKTYYITSDESDATRCAFYLFDENGNSLGGADDISVPNFYWAGNTKWYLASNNTKLKYKIEFKGTGASKIAYLEWQEMRYINVQFEEGTSATPYTPYISDFNEVKVKTRGKNLFDYEEVLRRWDNNEHYQVGDYRVLSIQLKPNTKYYISVNGERKSGTVLLGTLENVAAGYAYSVGVSNTWDAKKAVTTDDTGKMYIGTPYAPSMTRERFETALVQIEYGTAATEYEPYKDADYTANADGTVENVKSISPIMNISTDTAGVIISAECFKDAQKEIESLTTAIALTGGN